MPFEFQPQSDYLLLKLSGECMGDEKPSVLEEYKKAYEACKLKILIVQCQEASMIHAPFLRNLAMIYKEIKSINGKMRLVGAAQNIQEQIKKSGLDMILVNKMSLRGALIDIGLAKKKEFDVNFINPFLNASQKVFKVQCFTETTPGKPALKQASDPLLMGDISGIISITSEAFTGTLAISLSEKVFCHIASKMLGEEISAIKEENVDLVGELANIILGQAKIELNSMGYAIQMALPSCVWGKDHKIKHFGGGVCIVIPFECEAGTFYTEIMTNNNILQQVNPVKKAA